jgi:phage terminase small subunit
MTDSPLTPKQDKVCRLYIETGNASEAYRRSYDASRMASATINRKATELVAHGAITARLEELRAGHQKRHELTVDRIVAEYVKIAFADAGDFFDWGPDGVKVKDKADLTPEQRAVIAEVSQTITEAGGTIRVKLHNKLDALEKLGRHLGVFKVDNEQQGKAAGEAIAKEMTDFEAARRIAFLFGRAVGRGDNKTNAPPADGQLGEGEPHDADDQH